MLNVLQYLVCVCNWYTSVVYARRRSSDTDPTMASNIEDETTVNYKEQSLKACKLLCEMSKNLDSVTNSINSLTEDIKSNKYDSKKGLSLFDLKNHTFVSYTTNLVYTTLLKLSGKSINGSSVVDRLIEDRIVIERLRPYETKLKHQIEKYFKADLTDGDAETTEVPQEQGLSVKDFTAGDTDKEDEEQENDEEASTSKGLLIPGAAPEESSTLKAYIVPKISQNKFSDGRDDSEKAAEARRRLLSSAMMQDALYEHRLEPDVIQHSNALQRKASKRRAEITKYEEENLTRMRLSKKERSMLNAAPTAGAMHGELLGFSDVSLLGGSAGGATLSKGAKKRKISTTNKKSIKAKKKRNRRMH
ncbi:Sas10/Utp3/C1D [Trinorchestia longiramus]|nr:Sas10/Utp3/C1D [Trinorchestia longiramus]